MTIDRNSIRLFDPETTIECVTTFSTSISPDGLFASVLFDDLSLEFDEQDDQLIKMISLGMFFPVKASRTVSKARYQLDLRGIIDKSAGASISLNLLLGTDSRSLQFEEGDSISDREFTKRFTEKDSYSQNSGLPLALVLCLRRRSARSNGMITIDSMDLSVKV